MTELAKADGLEYRFDVSKPSNTFDAHRMLHFAHENGLQDALKERYFKAYLSEGVSMSDREALVRLAVEIGLDAAAAREVAFGEAHALDVRADEDEAREIGVRGVPFFVFDGRLAVSGAESAEVLGKAMAEAFSRAGDQAPRGARRGHVRPRRLLTLGARHAVAAQNVYAESAFRRPSGSRK